MTNDPIKNRTIAVERKLVKFDGACSKMPFILYSVTSYELFVCVGKQFRENGLQKLDTNQKKFISIIFYS